MLWNVGYIIEDVANKIRWSSIKGLCAQTVAGCIDARIAHDPYVIHGPVSLDEVIVDVCDKIVVDVS